MQSGEYLWNADNVAVLDMDWLLLSSSVEMLATNLSAIDCLSSDDGSSTTDWSICLLTTIGAGEISIDASTDAEADWEMHTNNDCATTKGGSIKICSLKPPAAVTPMEEIPSTLIAWPAETDTVVKDTECDKNADHPYNNKVTLQSQKIIRKSFSMVDGVICFMAAGKSTPISKFHVVDPNKLEKPFVVTSHYIDSDFWGMWEEHNLLKLFPNEGFWWSNIEKEASVAIDATVSLLGSSGARVTNDRTKTMVQYGYTASTISSLGVYITSFTHDPRKPGGAVKNIKPLRINQGVFAENQQPAFKNIKAKKDKVKMHKALLTSLQMLGNKMKLHLEETLDHAFVDGWKKKLLRVWDVAASAAQEVPVRSSIDGLHCVVIVAKDVCSDFHIDDNNTSSYACPIPDFHNCLTNNPMIAFTHVFLDTKNNEAIIVLVLQPKGTVTNFFGANTYHGALCAMSLMNNLCDSGIPGMFHGTNEDEYNNMRVRCKVQQVEKERQVWATYVNKKLMFIIDSMTAYYHISGKEPLIFEHFLWTAGKMPYIHRQGQQLTMEEIEQNRQSRDGLGYLSTCDMEMTVATFQVCN